MFLVSCESKVKKENLELKERITALELENEAYKNKQVTLNTSVKDYRKFLKEINNNLKEIDISSSMIGKLDAEINKDADLESQIKARIRNVEELIQNSRLKIIALDSRLNSLRKTSQDKSEEILSLESDLSQAILDLIQRENEYLELSSRLDKQEIITNDLRAILNRAYYYAGTAKDLTEKGIIEKEGGFIGLGRVKVINANAPDSLFIQTKKDELDSLVFSAKNIELISQHPEGSYEIRSKNFLHKLFIINKEEFWGPGNYLVVQKNS